MENEEQVIDETSEVEEEVEETNVEEEEIVEESPEELKARLAKAEELANNYKARAEKAEKKAKQAPKQESGDLTSLDILALAKANIEKEDIDEVLDYAKYKGISVEEALNSNIVKTTIAEKSEQRKSAQAVNTGATRRGNSQVSDERLLADARKGIMPEKEEDLSRLAVLRFKNK